MLTVAVVEDDTAERLEACLDGTASPVSSVHTVLGSRIRSASLNPHTGAGDIVFMDS